MTGHVKRGVVPGVVTLVGRWAEARVEAIGMKAYGAASPAERSIYS